MNKKELIGKIKNLEGLESDDKTYLINLVNTKKKYGLVWEDKPEDVEEQLRANLPVLQEVKEKAIINGEGHPNHILIEGDNLHALTALTFTHENKIDLIYIDPPYNTGNKDFIYNDSYVDNEDVFRHSKWLSFMYKRLNIAKNLLRDDGLIFLSIDDNEYAQLKMLLDDIFGNNLINSITVKSSETSGVKMNHTEKKLPKIKEYILIYAKNKSLIKLNPVKINKIDDAEKFHKYSKYYSKIILDKSKPVAEWDILTIKEYLKKNNLTFNKEELIEFKIENADRIIYRTNNNSLSKLNFETELAEVVSPTGLKYVWWEGKQMLFLKDYIEESLCDLWIDISTINLNKEMCGLKSFENGQKPLELIVRVLKLFYKRNCVVLDFFAGSGTTLHSIINQNTFDNGYRQGIIVTNNENNIAEKVTYERSKRVIQGYQNANGDFIRGLKNNNLRYYKTDFVPSNKTEQNKRKLTQLSTDLLCIKEDCYTEITEKQGFNPKQCRIFCGVNSKYMIVVYHSRQISEVCQSLINYIPSVVTNKKIRLYVFSPEKETLLEEFQDVEDKIIAVPLPDAIYNAYRATFKTLKLDKKPLEVKNLDDDASSETDLFTNTEKA